MTGSLGIAFPGQWTTDERAERDGDAGLMLRAGQDDVAAFAELYDRHRNGVYNQLYALVRDHHTAEDLCQEVFFRVYRYRRTYQPRARFETWLFCITRRVGLNALRACRRLRRRLTCASDLPGIVARTLEWHTESVVEPLDQCLLRQERSAQVHAALSRLPEQQRTVVVLQHFQQCGYAEIASRLQLSHRSVKRHVVRARRNLQRLLVSEAIQD